MRIPDEIAEQISNRALEIARRTAPKKTGKGALFLKATSSTGQIGIEVPDEVAYMSYQDEGFGPFVMDSLAGKTIPMRDKDGKISFRRATAKKIGTPIVTRDSNGDLIKPKVAWRHPGITGSHFIEKALRQATSEWVQTRSGQDMIRMLDESAAADLMQILRGHK